MRYLLLAIHICLALYVKAYTTVTDEGAWCWFADPRALHYEDADASIDMTYIGYIDIHGNIKAMQYDHRRGCQTEVLVRSCFQPDDHDNPTFLALPDGRIMIFYSRHTDEPCFYYRISQVAGDITTLGDERVIPTEHNTTYPSPFILSSDPDHIYLCWRGINWHPTIARLSLPDSKDNVLIEDGPYQIVQSTGARPYAKYTSDGDSRIWMAYTTGHPDNESPNYLYCNYIDISDMSLHDICGTKHSDIRQAPLRVDKSTDFVASHSAMVPDASPYRDWVWQVALDDDRAPVIAMTRISTNKRSHNYYVARAVDGQWQKHMIAYGGGHFHQSPDIEHCYSGGMAIDPDNPQSVYCSVPVAGTNGTVYEIVNYRLDPNGETVSAKAITSNSAANNVRPYVIDSAADAPIRLAWMHGDYYDWIVSSQRPLGYCTGIQADFAGFDTAAETADIDASYVYNGTGITLTIDGKPLTYTVDTATMKPQIEYKGRKYPSTNVLGSTDIWREKPRGTDGKWHKPSPLESPVIRFVYTDGTLSTYINGLLDQRVRLR